jgi:uncharacterized protein (DUF2062 family)
MDFGPQQIGKWLIAAGIIIALLGAIIIALGRVGLFNCPAIWNSALKTGVFIFQLPAA